MGILDGKAAVVTGGGRGIGRGHCLHLAEQGASVLVNAIDVNEAQKVVDEITEQQERFLPDILSSDGKLTYLRSQKIEKDGTRIEIGPVSGNPAAQGAKHEVCAPGAR